MTCEPHIQMKCVTLLLLLLLLLSALAVASENPACHVYVRVRYCRRRDTPGAPPFFFCFSFFFFRGFNYFVVVVELALWRKDV